MQKMLRENGDKVNPDERSKIEAAINNLKDVMNKDDINAIKNSNGRIEKDKLQLF